MMNQKSFDRDINGLADVFQFINMNLEKYGIPQNSLLELELTAEELFTNMVRHNQTSDKPINISIGKHGRAIRIIFSDYSKNPFDLTKADEVDLDEHLAERKSGGLGLHLVKTFMDEVHFEHSDDISTITLIKNI